MNPLLSLFLLFFLINYSEAECGISSCQCKDIKSLTNPYSENITGTSGPGCSLNYSCARKNDTFALIFIENIFPQTNDIEEGSQVFFTFSRDNSTVGQNENVQDIFGIKCKNGDWVATIFPSGISYTTVNHTIGYIPAEDVNGKGYEILIQWFWCTDDTSIFYA